MINNKATTIEEVVNHIYNDSFFVGYSNSFFDNKYLGEEIFSEFLLLVCEMNLNKLLEIYNRGEFNYYASQMIRRVVINNSSIIKKNIKSMRMSDELKSENHYINRIENIPNDEQQFIVNKDKVNSIIYKIYEFLDDYKNNISGGWYEVQLFEMHFFEKMTYREIEKQTKIPHTSLFHSVKIIEEKIKKEFGEEYKKIKYD